MSVCATIATWKLNKKQITPTQKLILLSYADRVGESFECWPSNKRLELDTGLDRHTICENKQELLKKGLIVYTGEKRGKTKSVDVIRLTYVIPREGREDESSVQTPTAQKSSSGQMPIAKQCGNAHTEPKRVESLSTTTTTTSSSVVFNEKIDTELTVLQNKYLPSDERSTLLFLKQCKWHVDHGSKDHTFNQRVNGLKKIIKGGVFDSPVGYPNIKKYNGINPDVILSQYNHYVKSPIEIKLRAQGIAKLLSFEEWKTQQCIK